MKVVMVHGSGQSSVSYHYVARWLGGRGDALTLPGHPEGRPCPTVERYTEWVRGYIAGRGYREVVLMGHSLGGAIVQQYALDYPEEVRGVILVGTGARLRVHPDILRLCEEATRGEEGYRRWWDVQVQAAARMLPEVRPLALEAVRRNGPAVMLNDLLACDRWDMLDRVGHLRVPALVLCGTEDVMTPPRYSRYLAERLPRLSRLVLVEGATHAVLLERPEEVIRAVEAFLEGLGSEG